MYTYDRGTIASTCACNSMQPLKRTSRLVYKGTALNRLHQFVTRVTTRHNHKKQEDAR